MKTQKQTYKDPMMEMIEKEMIAEMNQFFKEEYPKIYEDDMGTTKKLKIDIPQTPFNDEDDPTEPIPEKDGEVELEDLKDKIENIVSKSDSHFNYLVKKGILNDPNKVSKINSIKDPNAKVIILSKWFRSLDDDEQRKVIHKHTKDWWRKYGDKSINTLYTELLYNDVLIGNKETILDNWDQCIHQNINAICKKLFWG